MELVLIIRVLALRVFLVVEQGPSRNELRHDAAHGPQVDGLGVVLGPQQQLWRAIPDGRDVHVLHQEGGGSGGVGDGEA